MPVTQDEGDNESGDAAFGRMLASHNQNMQNPSRPLDDADDSFAGEPSASLCMPQMERWRLPKVSKPSCSSLFMRCCCIVNTINIYDVWKSTQVDSQ